MRFEGLVWHPVGNRCRRDPEQVRGYGGHNIAPSLNMYPLETLLEFSPPGDANSAALALRKLLIEEDVGVNGKNAADDAKKRFDLKLQVERYLAWFEFNSS
jgi:hypothetical protein